MLRLLSSPRPALSAGALLAEEAMELHRPGSGVRLAISGGSALAAAVEMKRRLLAARPEVWWELRLTLADERRVALDHPNSNLGAAVRELRLDDEPCAFLLPLWLHGDSVEENLRRIESGLELDFDSGLDLALLGLGPDGHSASLFPGRWQALEPGPVAAIDDSPKPPPQRITLTRSFLATSSRTILVAAGESKRKALKALVTGDHDLPATDLLRLLVVTDQVDLGN